MAMKRKKPTCTQRIQAWMDGHNGIACISISFATAATLVGLFLFVTMAGFGASADFIYNQF